MKHILVMVVALIGLSWGTTGHSQDLERAYQKEMAYLQSQKRALKSRLTELDAKNRKVVKAAQSEVEQLQGRLSNLSVRADELENTLRSAERETTGVQDAADTLAGVFEQGSASLKRYKKDILVPEMPGPEDLANLYLKGIEAIDEGQHVRKTTGSFFLEDGTQVSGTIVELGRIAAWGVSDRGAGALAPAGDGRLKLWPGSAAETAKSAATSMPAHGGIFLFETTDRAVEQGREKTLADVVRASGVIGWVICALGILGLLFIVIRTVILGFAGRGRYALIDEVVTLIRADRIAEAQRFVASKSGPFARVLSDTVNCMRVDREKLEDAVSAAILRETPALERFGSVIMVFATVSPLLGLLGTVTGMIATFDVITEFGTGDPKMLSGGISEALVTTQLGLIVAIPCVLIGNLLNNRANGLLDDLQYGALRTVNATVESPERSVQRPESAVTPLSEATA